MKKNTGILLLYILITMGIFAGCSSSPTASSPSASSPSASGQSAISSQSASASAPTAESGPSAAASTELTLTLDELSQYNGQNGQPAYIAVDGVIYDVSNVPQWQNGEHKGFSSGLDCTDAIKNSPHGISKLDGVPVVGKLAS